MWIAVGFGVAVLVGIGAALAIAFRGTGEQQPLPWNVSDLARLQASVMAVLGSVSITGIVLAVGFLSSRAGEPRSIELNTVVLMFSVTFGFFINTAFTLSYLPDRAVVGEILFRFYYGLASTLQFRTVLLLVFALINFAGLYGLSLAVDVLAILTPVMTAGAFIVIAVVADSLGLMRFGECYLAAAAGLLMGAAFYAAMRWIAVDDDYAHMTMALVFACVNGFSYVLAGLVPLAPRRPALQGWLSRNARRLTVIDMQITIVSLIFLWLVVAGPL